MFRALAMLMTACTIGNEPSAPARSLTKHRSISGHGGSGQITDVQQPRYGQQVMDVLPSGRAHNLKVNFDLWMIRWTHQHHPFIPA
jgi:hypothetical protein